MKRRRKKEKKKESSRHEEKKEERKEERKEKTEKQMWREEERKKKLVIRQDTKQWVPFVDKNYWKCHLTLFSVFKNSQIVFSILVYHNSKTKKLSDENITSKQNQTSTLWWGPRYFRFWVMKTQWWVMENLKSKH